MTAQAKQSPIGANRLIYLPYLMGERSPLLDEKARGAFIGLSAMHQKGDLIRAVMEGVTFSQRECLEILEYGHGTGYDHRLRRRSTQSLLQKMLADILGCTIQTSPCIRTGTLVLPFSAGVCAGVYDDAAMPPMRLYVRGSNAEVMKMQLRNMNRFISFINRFIRH